MFRLFLVFFGTMLFVVAPSCGDPTYAEYNCAVDEGCVGNYGNTCPVDPYANGGTSGTNWAGCEFVETVEQDVCRRDWGCTLNIFSANTSQIGPCVLDKFVCTPNATELPAVNCTAQGTGACQERNDAPCCPSMALDVACAACVTVDGGLGFVGMVVCAFLVAIAEST